VEIRFRTWAVALLALGLLAAGCGDDDDGGDEGAAEEEAAACDPLPLKTDGQLTVATGEPAFPPWVGDPDPDTGEGNPESGEGFESALVYALAEELGLDTVVWTGTGFDEAIAPGPKDYDFNIQQYSITEERDEVVDFSDGYYDVEQALVAAEDSTVAEATSIADLQDDRLGAAIGTTSLAYIEDVIQPDSDPAVFDDNAAAKAAFDAGQIDGLVFDLPTAYFITAVEIPDASIVGTLPQVGAAPEQLGMLFEDGSPLVPCVNEALSALRDDGTLAALEEEWLSAGGDIPELSE
jgi:polar amino acid transport system substrate-binding protein